MFKEVGLRSPRTQLTKVQIAIRVQGRRTEATEKWDTNVGRAVSLLASVRRPCTLIAIWTFVSCVRGLLSPASLNMRARATLPRVVLLLRTSTLNRPIINLYPPVIYLLSNITWIGTPDTCALSIFPSKCVFLIDSEFYRYTVASGNLPLMRHN